MRRPRPKQYIRIALVGGLAGAIVGLVLAEVGRLALLAWALLLMPSLFYFVLFVWKGVRAYTLSMFMGIILFAAVAGVIAAWAGWISGDDPKEQYLLRWLGVGTGLLGGLCCAPGMLRRWYRSRLRAGEPLDHLIEALYDADPVARRCAARALQTAQTPEAIWAVPALLLAVQDDDETVRGRAADALRAWEVMHDHDVLPPPASAAPQWPLKRRVAWSCGLAILALATFAFSYTYFGRLSAACLVRDLGGDWAVPRLLGQACDTDALIKRAGRDGLRRLGPRAVPALVEALGDTDEEVRVTAADTLGEVGPAAIDAVEALQRAAAEWPAAGRRHPNELMPDALHAVQALARIDPRSAERFLPALVRWLHSGDWGAQCGAIACLRLMGPVARPAVAELRQELETITRRLRDLPFKHSAFEPAFGSSLADRERPLRELTEDIKGALRVIARKGQ